MKPIIFRQLWLTLSIFSIIIGFSSCKTVAALKSAKNSFNEGAKTEQLYGNTSSETALNGSPEAAQVHYQAAFDGIVKALAEEEAKLKKTGGYGQALALKALSAWRLQDYLVARTTASQAYQALKKEKTTQVRELALTAAMDGFIELETAYDSLLVLRKHLMRVMNQDNPSAAIFERSQQHYENNIWKPGNGMAFVESGLQNIETARTEAANEDDIQRYLTFAQLTGLETWSDELQEIRDVVKSLRLSGSLEVSGWLETQNRQFKAEKKRVLDTYAQQIAGGVESMQYKAWDRALVGVD